MELSFDTKVINAGNQTNGDNRKDSAARIGSKPVAVSILGMIEVKEKKGTGKATIYIGQNGGSYVMTKSARGLTPFCDRDSLNRAVQKAISDIRGMEAPFANLAQLRN